MKKMMLLVMLIGSVFALSGCTEKLDDLEYIQDKGTLILGFTEFPPMGFVENGVTKGFDIEIAEKVMERLGVTMETKYIDWSAKELELKSRRVDAVWNGMTITEERKLQMTFSAPYFDNQLVILSRASSALDTVEDLKGMVIGVELSSSADIALSAREDIVSAASKVKKYATSSDALLALQAGQIDALIVDEIFARYEVLEKTDGIFFLGTEVLGHEEYGIGYRLGDTQLRDRIDEILDELYDEGIIGEISEKYFGENLFKR